MSFWSRLGRIFTVDDTILDEDFSLIDYDDPNPQDERAKEESQDTHRDVNNHNKIPPQTDMNDDQETNEETQKESADQVLPQADIPKETEDRTNRTEPESKFIKPLTVSEYNKRRNHPPEAEVTPAPEADLGSTVKRGDNDHTREEKKEQKKEHKPSNHSDDINIPETLSSDLKENIRVIKKVFRMPQNADVIIREIIVGTKPEVKAIVVFMEGMSDKIIIDAYILKPLMMTAHLMPDTEVENRIELINKELLPGNQVMEYEKWEDVVNNILAGSTVVIVEGEPKALAVETKGWSYRAVSQARTETVVRGPQDAFTENFRTNTGLIRSKLRTEHLVTEMIPIGKVAKTDVAVMYMDGIVNKRLVDEVRRRIKAIDVDVLFDSGELEQLIEDGPISLVPRMMSTERPDRAVAFLSEGFVVVLVGMSPFALIMPTMHWTLMQTAEDYYVRYPFGSYIRLIRYISMFLALFLPSLYIAMTNFHPEMIPTDLMLSIAAARERVPFPVIGEVLMMEFSMELIREAGIRIPNVIGPTIGIVGALILGQAAVQAGIISPILIIIVAVTALASFTTPNYNTSYTIRVMRFFFIALASIWGFYGISLGIMVFLMHLVTLKSFGVPMMSPVAPFRRSSPDIILRGPIFKMEKRPIAIHPQKVTRQSPVQRPWDPRTKDSEEARKARKNKQQAQSNEVMGMNTNAASGQSTGRKGQENAEDEQKGRQDS